MNRLIRRHHNSLIYPLAKLITLTTIPHLLFTSLHWRALPVSRPIIIIQVVYNAIGAVVFVIRASAELGPLAKRAPSVTQVRGMSSVQYDVGLR